MKTLWESRFDTQAHTATQRFTASVDLDHRLGEHDVRYSRAHTVALRAAGVLSGEEAEVLDAALATVGAELAHDELELDPALEDIHTVIENRVSELAGSIGAKLHTGRSRNDQVATDMRLFLMDAIDTATRLVRELQAALVNRAAEHVDDILPAYSHLQRAQPVSLAHHLLAYVWMLERDRQRLRETRVRTARLPAGAAACCGTAIPLDRAALAHSLGFDAPTENSLDAVSDRDFIAEFLSVAAQCLGHCGRLASDLCLWATREFGFVKLPDAFCTGSSMMPHKANPDVLELIRGKTAGANADLTGLLGLLHALPLGYHRDLQEDKVALFAGSDRLLEVLVLLPEIVDGLRFCTPRMRIAANDSALLTTDWAEELVAAGVPFREAHAAVARLVREAEHQVKSPDQISTTLLREIHELLPRAIAAVPDAATSIARKATSGSTGTDALIEQLKAARELVSM